MLCSFACSAAGDKVRFIGLNGRYDKNAEGKNLCGMGGIGMPWIKRNMHYTLVERENLPWQWSYSAAQLQDLLGEACGGRLLLRVLISLDGYLEGACGDGNSLDLRYVGAAAVLVFEDHVLEFIFHAQGQVEYRRLRPDQIRFREKYGKIPAQVDYTDTEYYDLTREWKYARQGARVTGVSVPATDGWAFRADGFDEALAGAAAKKKDLPRHILFSLDSGEELAFLGDPEDAFRIRLTK